MGTVRSSVVAAFFFGMLLSSHYAHSLRDEIRAKRMVSGTDVEPLEAPYQTSVRLLDPDRHLGSGAILNVRFVLTQASFIFKLLRQYPERQLSTLARIRFGQLELKSQTDDQFRPIQSCTFHPEFDFELALYDLALLRTATEIEFGLRVQPIGLRRGPIPDESIVRYTDWGADKLTATQDDFNEKLQKMTAQAISNERCKELLAAWDLQEFVYESRVCIYTNGIGSICTGNAGGPLVIIEEGQPQLVGVMTYVYRACNSTVPGGFERLWNHYGWITKTSTVDYRYANLAQTCRVVRNVASQLRIHSKKVTERLRKANVDVN